MANQDDSPEVPQERPGENPHAIPPPPGGEPVPERVAEPGEPVRERVVEPGEPVPVDDPAQPLDDPETEEERELREMREKAVHGELEVTPEQARRWQHELRLPDAALPANDNEPERE